MLLLPVLAVLQLAGDRVTLICPHRPFRRERPPKVRDIEAVPATERELPVAPVGLFTDLKNNPLDEIDHSSLVNLPRPNVIDYRTEQTLDDHLWESRQPRVRHLLFDSRFRLGKPQRDAHFRRVYQPRHEPITTIPEILSLRGPV